MTPLLPLLDRFAARLRRLPRSGLLLLAACAWASLSSGCRQKMADQPYYRPYEPSDFFADGRSARPLERGVIHRAQYLETDPIATGLTLEEWQRAYALAANPTVDLKTPTPIENRDLAVGAPRFDPRDKDKPKVYVEEFPFPLTEADLRRGQERYTIYCAVCHGPLGNGQGKIWERGYLTPTSFKRAHISGVRSMPLVAIVTWKPRFLQCSNTGQRSFATKGSPPAKATKGTYSSAI